MGRTNVALPEMISGASFSCSPYKGPKKYWLNSPVQWSHYLLDAFKFPDSRIHDHPFGQMIITQLTKFTFSETNIRQSSAKPLMVNKLKLISLILEVFLIFCLYHFLLWMMKMARVVFNVFPYILLPERGCNFWLIVWTLNLFD